MLAVRGEVDRLGEGRCECHGEFAVACVRLEEPLDHEAEAVPGIRVGKRLVDDDVARAQLALEGLGGERLLGGEVAVQGGGADARPAGDLPHRHVQAVGGE